MLGAIIGDTVGSVYEWDNIKTKKFEFFSPECFPTDDSIMTAAIAKAILDCKGNFHDRELLNRYAVKEMQSIGRHYPDCGYGGNFESWIFSDDPKPYGSYGNGAAMRVSPCGFAASSLEEARFLSGAVTEVTHNHKEGIKGAEATATAIYLAKTGSSQAEIQNFIQKYYYPMDFTVDKIRDGYEFTESSQGTVPYAIKCFLEADSFEDAIRTAISIGGDSDTVAAITGGIAEAYFGIPESIRKKELTFLDYRLIKILEEFEKTYPPKRTD